ncbi:hypothetical protein OC845_004119 [Tilletia horrida]|nr:hypothetical protein OC845_004119 [Tilletia horrida]
MASTTPNVSGSSSNSNADGDVTAKSAAPPANMPTKVLRERVTTPDRATTTNVDRKSGPDADPQTDPASRPPHTRSISTQIGLTSPSQIPHSGSPFIYPIRSAVKVRPSAPSESGSASNKSLDSTIEQSRTMSMALPSPSEVALSSATSMESRSPASQTFQPQYYSHQLGSSPPPLSQTGLERALSQGSGVIPARSGPSQQSHSSSAKSMDPKDMVPSHSQDSFRSSGLDALDEECEPATALANQCAQTIVTANATAPAALLDAAAKGKSGFTNSEDTTWEGQTTMRFTHVQTEEGHMVLTGRDGKLMKCEDEPIHIPGAIQSFGCMVVVREDEEGVLVVRQCSENTGDILSLSPAYLFSLPSFLDTMDDDQADILWDNIEALNDSPEELNETGPTVFRLHGWGQPGPGTGRARARKHWDVWCAAHRPEPQNDDGSPPLIILEFELVNDTNNPRNPPTDGQKPVGALPPTFSEEEHHSETGSIRIVKGESAVPSGMTFRRSSSTATTNTSPPSSEVTTTTDSDRTTRNPSGSLTPSVGTGTPLSANGDIGTPRGGLEGQPYIPAAEDVAESTLSTSKPLKALARMRLSKERAIKGSSRRRQGAGGPGVYAAPGAPFEPDDVALDMFGILAQANEQLAAQTDLQSFLKVAVSVVREITMFSRVMIYQFDEQWNGQVVCELVNWNDTHDLYRGLHFPASDIPAQARAMYKLNKIRLLYDRDQTTARLVCRDHSDLERPVDMTHCFLRAMSPIHIKYLANMGVRASMSISIIAFDQLWGLIALHTYGDHGKRVSFPVRQLSRLIGDSISRNIERLSYARRLSARKLINTLPTDKNPSGYIISNAEDLLALFDADFGIIAVGQEAKILGPLDASQEVLAVTEYLRIKRFDTVVTSNEMLKDFPDMDIPTTLKTLAGLLVVPLTPTGGDFIAFLRKAQLRQINWAGKPFKDGKEANAILDPRKSFKKWSETVEGTARAWKDEELETASVLCLVYGKFISVWRQREQAIQHNAMNKLLLSNASHEVRTPLNHIINYLEMALDGPLDTDTRDNLSKSHLASKSLLFVINDLLDLTRQEEGKKLYLQEPFDLGSTLREAVEMHESEAKRRKIDFSLEMDPEHCMVLGDKNKVRQIVVNSVTNAVSHTKEGQVTVAMYKRTGEDMTTSGDGKFDMEAEIVISDTGVGIPKEKLESIFREIEQVESVLPSDIAPGDKMNGSAASILPAPRHGVLGLGLAINARIVKNLGGQLRVQSTVGEGSRFSYFIPFSIPPPEGSELMKKGSSAGSSAMRRSGSRDSGGSGSSAGVSEIDSLVEALNAPHLGNKEAQVRSNEGTPRRSLDSPGASASEAGPSGIRVRQSSSAQRKIIAHDFAWEKGSGSIPVEGSSVPLRSVKIDPHSLDSIPLTSDYFNTSVMSSELDAAVAQHKLQRRGMTGAASSYDSVRSAGSRKDSSLTSSSPNDEINATLNPSVREPSSSRSAFAPPGGGPQSPLSPPLDSPSSPSKAAQSPRSAFAKKKLGRTRPTSPGSERPDVPPLRALVVEDDPINAAILKKRLLLDQHSVIVAVNGEEGVQRFLEQGYEIDLVLMDLQMPICNGREACRRIRAIEKERAASRELQDRPASHVLNGGVPILAVSATLTEDMREELEGLGFDGWLLKPIDFARLAHLKKGITNLDYRSNNLWHLGYIWERGGWLHEAAKRTIS